MSDSGRTFSTWSMRPPASLDALGAQEPESVSCIVCFETEESMPDADWHHCLQCKAMWCDECGESMYNAAQEREEPDAEMRCPQCRKSVADMQHEQRVQRLVDRDGGVGCTEAHAGILIAYEHLLTETVHLCECESPHSYAPAAAPDGRPYFTQPPATVARVLSRDAICDVVREEQGAAEGSRLRRLMRAQDYGGVMGLVMRGYAAALRRGGVPSSMPFLEAIVEDLRWMSLTPAPTPALDALMGPVLAAVADELGLEQPAGDDADALLLEDGGERRRRRRRR